MTEPNKLKRKFADVTIVVIVVGEEKKTFKIHEDTLFNASTYFKKTFTSKFKREEEEEKTMELLDEDALLFDVFVTFLYSNNLDLPTYDPSQKAGCVLYAARLYAFADKYDVLRLRNAVCSALFSLPAKASLKPPPRSAIEVAYRSTTRKSSLCRLLVDWTAYHCYTGWFDKTINEAWLLKWPAFAVDLAIAFAKGGECDPKDGPFMKEKADYYDEAEPTKSQPMTINLLD